MARDDDDDKPGTLLVDTGDVIDFLDELAGMQKHISEATGKLRARLAVILKEQTFHKGAFGLIRKLDAMSPEERADFRRTFDVLYPLMISEKWGDDTDDMISRLDDAIDGEDQPDAMAAE